MLLDERRREAVALVDELLEDRLSLPREHREPGTAAAITTTRMRSNGASACRRYFPVHDGHSCRAVRSPVLPRGAATRTRGLGALLGAAGAAAGGSRSRRRSGPADGAAGEDEAIWLERARSGCARPARPAHALDGSTTRGPRPAGPRSACGPRVAACGASPAPTLFAAAGTRMRRSRRHAPSSGTSTAFPRCPPSVSRERRAVGIPSRPARIRLARLHALAIPTTHSLGDSARALLRRRAPPESSTRTSTTPTCSIAAGGRCSRLAPLAPRSRADRPRRAGSEARRRGDPRSPGTT